MSDERDYEPLPEPLLRKLLILDQAAQQTMGDIQLLVEGFMHGRGLSDRKGGRWRLELESRVLRWVKAP